MKTYFDVVADFVGIENICNGPSNGPISKIKFIDGFVNIPTEEQIQAKIAELEAAEPMRLLRVERDRRIAKTDWRFRSDLTPSQAWIDYCQALRDLPANSTPALDENGNLTGINWPTPPESE
jgi:hypothetical protein